MVSFHRVLASSQQRAPSEKLANWETIVKRGHSEEEGVGASNITIYISMEDGQEMVLFPDREVRKKEQKDAELDKKIKALKKKNEALVRRFQEIEADRKNAEREGKAVTSQKTKQENLTITIKKASREKRSVSDKRSSSDSEDHQRRTVCMGKEMQVAVTVDSKVENKKAVRKNDQDRFLVTSNMPDLTMEEVDRLFTFGRGRRFQIAIAVEQGNENDQDLYLGMSNVPHLTMEEVDHLFTFGRGRRMQIATGIKHESSGQKCGKREKTSPGEQPNKEELEYLKWKKEREQIDRDRLARQRNSKGEWRRLWDMEKPNVIARLNDKAAVEGYRRNSCKIQRRRKTFRRAVTAERIPIRWNQKSGTNSHVPSRFMFLCSLQQRFLSPAMCDSRSVIYTSLQCICALLGIIRYSRRSELYNCLIYKMH
ncbi:coiled-coil domain-containing protein 9B isoform X3 [Hyperolius riggenbachi]|uniref:coiled-coil domain-containing protein 9B isoform X3 n=1 Tax=Hyperolius riggenbachi TaxID=752182 RepID=UPI0035A32BE2